MSSDDRPAGSELSPPRLPEVTRLNRNVLLVAAMGVGVVILAVTHVVRSDARSAAADSGTAATEVGAVASFLAQPPLEGTGEVPIPPPAYPGLMEDIDAAVADDSHGATIPARVDGGYTAPSYRPHDISSGGPPTPARPSLREEAYQRALRAGLRTRDGTGAAPVVSSSFAREPYTAPEHPLAEGIPVHSLAVGSDPRPVAPPRPRNRQAEFMAAAAEHRDPPAYIASRVQAPISEYQIMAGTVLPAMMVTEINSDLPGEILAQISRNLYDSQQRHLLIPRGTRVIGRYDSQVALGQSRVLIAWTRLIFPDGRSLSLPGLPTQDLRGAAGLRSRVNNHYGRIYGQAILLSIIGAGAQLSQPQQSSILTPPSAGQVAAGALGQELSQVSMETIRRNLDVRPTLQVRSGTEFYIFLERDLVLEGPYSNAR